MKSNVAALMISLSIMNVHVMCSHVNYFFQRLLSVHVVNIFKGSKLWNSNPGSSYHAESISYRRYMHVSAVVNLQTLYLSFISPNIDPLLTQLTDPLYNSPG